MANLKTRLDTAIRDAMRNRDKGRLGALRLIAAECKQVEIDERVALDDQKIIAILNRMLRRRRESLRQYSAAKRQDLVAQEQFEIDLIETFLPEPLTMDELQQLVDQIIAEQGATTMRDLGAIMKRLGEQVAGRADMRTLSGLVKERLSGASS